jgi:hypothetical protein
MEGSFRVSQDERQTPYLNPELDELLRQECLAPSRPVSGFTKQDLLNRVEELAREYDGYRLAHPDLHFPKPLSGEKEQALGEIQELSPGELSVVNAFADIFKEIPPNFDKVKTLLNPYKCDPKALSRLVSGMGIALPSDYSLKAHFEHEDLHINIYKKCVKKDSGPPNNLPLYSVPLSDSPDFHFNTIKTCTVA